MEWLTWFELKKYKVASMHVGPRKIPLYGIPRRFITIHLLHELNDHPPMKIIFELQKRSGRTIVVSIKNNLIDGNKIHIPVGIARDFDNANLDAVNGVLKTLSQKE